MIGRSLAGAFFVLVGVVVVLAACVRMVNKGEPVPYAFGMAVGMAFIVYGVRTML